MPSEYEEPAYAERYLRQVSSLVVNREQGERMVLDLLPKQLERVLDLGTGDGRLLQLVLDEHPDALGVGLDISPTMLEHAQARFMGRVRLVRHDLNEPLPELGEFDAVVSCFAIHHVSDARKRAVYQESFEMLRPNGVFANLEHVTSGSKRLEREFYNAIQVPVEKQDPSNQCTPVEPQLQWLREIGFEDVDCLWKWREIAVLYGMKPSTR